MSSFLMPFDSIFRLVFSLADEGSDDPRIKKIVTGMSVTIVIGACVAGLAYFVQPKKEILVAAAIATFATLTAGFSAISALQAIRIERARERKIETVEERAREHPEKPQLAWDLARAKLESYLDRNLSQVRSIYALTLLVMLCGFGFVGYGLYQVSSDTNRLPISIVASASGIIISFIGGSFLLIFRSILAQTRGYVTVLERINAVGMAVQVIASIPDSNADLKFSTTADLAKQLLNLYANAPLEGKTAAQNGE